MFHSFPLSQRSSESRDKAGFIFYFIDTKDNRIIHIVQQKIKLAVIERLLTEFSFLNIFTSAFSTSSKTHIPSKKIFYPN